MEQIYSLLQNRGVEWTEVHWTALYICSGLCNSVCFSAKLSRGNHIFTFLPNTSSLTFGELQSTGSVQVVQWTDGAPAWEVYSKMVHPPCGPSAICGKNKSLICSCLTGTAFSGLKLPDLAAIFRLDSASECERLCLNNCSCTAYAYAYVARIRCMVCSGDLLDMQDYSYSGEDLFLRLAYSELGNYYINLVYNNFTM
ncbi:hypothetical protein BC332_10642 [Capsicum chinense]|nr:hypothetical protein BC332_10642 [Capsicum chinense]